MCPPCVPRDCPPRLCPEDAPRAARPAAHAVTWPGLDRGRWEDAERKKRRLPRPGSPPAPDCPSTLVLPLSNQIKPLLRGNEGKPREADWDGLDRKRRKNTSKTAVFKGWWWGMDSNHRTHRGQIYSLLRLATSLPHQGIFRSHTSWWSGRDSNPRPLRCERNALPTELPPHVWFLGNQRGRNVPAERRRRKDKFNGQIQRRGGPRRGPPRPPARGPPRPPNPPSRGGRRLRGSISLGNGVSHSSGGGTHLSGCFMYSSTAGI